MKARVFSLAGGWVGGQLCSNLLGLLSFMYRRWVVVHMFACFSLQLKGGLFLGYSFTFGSYIWGGLVSFHGVFCLVKYCNDGYIELNEWSARRLLLFFFFPFFFSLVQLSQLSHGI